MKHYDSNQIRSFALVGHGGAGKTSVAEAILHITGHNSRLGSVSDGTSLMDYEEEEKERGGSLASSFLTAEYDGYKLHVADTPGDGDFMHDGYLAMQGVDVAVLVVSAVDGVETVTERMSALATELGCARAVFINKLDRERTTASAAVAELNEVLGFDPVLLQLPIGEGETFRGVVDLLSRKVYLYDGETGEPTVSEVPAELEAEVESAIEALTETVAMTDEELLELYLEEGELTLDQLREGLHDGMTSGALVPVVLGSATKNIGVDRLLWLARAFPSGADRRVPATVNGDTVEIDGDASAPLVALCFKSIIDPFVGHLSLFRAFRGTAGAEAHPTNTRDGKDERLGTYFHMIGKKHVNVDKVVAGDIFAIAKMKHTLTGDTLSESKDDLAVRWVDPPAPMISYVIKPLTRADEDKSRAALDRLLAEDKGLVQSFDDVTKEIVLSGRGANHITISVQKMRRKYGVNVELGTPTIPYRETLAGKADVRYRHKKQTGGAGQFGEVSIRVSPNERGEGFLFENKTVGGVIPSSLIPSVEKGVRAQLEKGILAGFPVVDVHVELYDGKSHPVDSKDIAFQIAGRQAIKQAVLQAKPILLEPIYDVEVVAPEENVGDIMGDMNTRRARIQTMEGRGRSSVVKAYVPLAEVLNYSPALKSMTGGKGMYTMAFHAYEPVPYSMQDKIVADVSRIRAGDDDH